MQDLIEFLTSKDILIVYAITGFACFLCFVIYLVDKNNIRFRQRHNTKELNKLVEMVKEKEGIVDEPEVNEEPVLEVIEETPKEEATVEEAALEAPVRDEVIVEPLSIQQEEETSLQDVEPEKVEDELEYTSIEPDQATAQLELKKLTEELQKQEEEPENIALTNYEEQQEENAIISLEELVKKSKDMYAANELTQYADEGNEPISLEELEKKDLVNTTTFKEPFVIENVVPEEELVEESIENKQKVVLQDFQSFEPKEAPKEVKRFKNSPIISPIFGIEKEESDNDIELENTADYEKLDAEIKKTNEFLMTLRELQKKLD